MLSVCTFDLHAADRGDGWKLLLEVFDRVCGSGFLEIGDDGCETDGVAVHLGGLVVCQRECLCIMTEWGGQTMLNDCRGLRTCTVYCLDGDGIHCQEGENFTTVTNRSDELRST